MYFNYGIGRFNINKFEKSTKTLKDINKLDGGLWCCNKNELYSDWLVMTLYYPKLVKEGSTTVGNNIELCEDCKLLTLTSKNYKNYTIDEIIDYETVKNFDAILFTEDLVDNVKSFESYYFESLHILNPECIQNLSAERINIKYVLSDEYKKKSSYVMKRIIEIVSKTEVFNELFELFNNRK